MMENKSRFSKRHYIIGVVVAIVIFTIWMRLLSHFHAHDEKEKTVSVNVIAVQSQSMPVLLQTAGTIEPVQSVNIRSQITGSIKKIDFTPGQTVQAGQLLFEIDPAPYQAALQQAQAVLARDQAQLKSTQLDEQRYAKLAKAGYVSKQDYDHLVANEAMQKATVQADQEAVKTAEIQLQYSQIHSPINGQTGSVAVKVGDLVTAASATPLVTINQIDPVLVNFNLPQNKLTKLLKYKNQAPINVEVWTETGHHLLGSGVLIFIDNNVNAETGTVLLKASIENTKHVLWPGLMVMAKIILAVESNALVVPSKAIQVDQQGQFVYLAMNKHAVIRRIKVDRQVGNLSVIASGLNVGEEVITVMPPDLENNSPIHIFPTTS